jgi:hypothetical protein
MTDFASLLGGGFGLEYALAVDPADRLGQRIWPVGFANHGTITPQMKKGLAGTNLLTLCVWLPDLDSNQGPAD